MDRMARNVGRTLAVVLLAVLCTACRVDVKVGVAMNADGSGAVTLTAVADADIVKRATSLATDLRFDDLKAAGWVIDGPAKTPTGGLQVTLSHPFQTPAQGTALLAGLNGPGGPLTGLTLARVRTANSTTYSLNGTLQVIGGLNAFTDPDLLAAVGATPYTTQLTAANVQPSAAIGITVGATLPGKLQSNSAGSGSGLTWTVPSDGSAVKVAAVAQQNDRKNVWAGPVAKGALIALIAWVVISICFIGYILLARRRRAAIRAMR